MSKFWSENKMTILTTAACVAAGLLVIRFFDVLLFGAIITAVVVGAVLLVNRAKKEHGSLEAAFEALMAKLFGKNDKRE